MTRLRLTLTALSLAALAIVSVAAADRWLFGVVDEARGGGR